MKTYKDIKIPGLGGDDYDEIWQRGYDAGYESGYTDGLNDCPGPTPYDMQYLTIEALEDGDFNLREMDYSINDGPWETASFAGYTISLNSGDKVRFKRIETAFSLPGGLSGNTIAFNAYGNVLSLKYGDSFQGENGPFNGASLFKNSTGLVSAKNLIFPTGLKTDCYSQMFYECTNLIEAPELPATTLESGCYRSMFEKCTSLTTAPELPATTLKQVCYNNMFKGCASLTTAPVLPAETLEPGCYAFMFYDCIKLNYIKCLAKDITASNCTQLTFYNLSPTGTFVKSAGTNWEIGGIYGIPPGWTVIEE